MEKDFRTLIRESLEHKNLTLERLSQLLNVPERYLTAIQNLDIAKLPASPYVRGYLQKIAQFFNLNFEELWMLYEKSLAHKTSGAHDKLPTNRFAARPFDKKKAAWMAVAALLILYLIFNAGTLIGKPPLSVTNPNTQTIAVTVPVFNLEGHINPKDKLTINGEEALGDANGNFQISFDLQPGLNTVEFKVKRFLGRETTIIRQILYEPEITAGNNN